VDAIAFTAGPAVAVGGDIGDGHAVRELFDAVTKRFGGVGIVANTAGIMILKSLAEFSLDEFDRMTRIYVRGTFVLSQLVS
jgi:3-oxoacyl-[acyl-carrier protein] reductase